MRVASADFGRDGRRDPSTALRALVHSELHPLPSIRGTEMVALDHNLDDSQLIHMGGVLSLREHIEMQ